MLQRKEDSSGAKCIMPICYWWNGMTIHEKTNFYDPHRHCNDRCTPQNDWKTWLDDAAGVNAPDRIDLQIWRTKIRKLRWNSSEMYPDLVLTELSNVFVFIHQSDSIMIEQRTLPFEVILLGGRAWHWVPSSQVWMISALTWRSLVRRVRVCFLMRLEESRKQQAMVETCLSTILVYLNMSQQQLQCYEHERISEQMGTLLTWYRGHSWPQWCCCEWQYEEKCPVPWTGQQWPTWPNPHSAGRVYLSNDNKMDGCSSKNRYYLGLRHCLPT